MKYLVYLTEVTSFTVEANSKAEALLKFRNGDYDFNTEQYVGEKAIDIEKYEEEE